MKRSLLSTTLAVAAGSSLALAFSYLYWLHDSLRRSTHHTSRSGTLASYSVSERIETVPEEIFSSNRYFSVYDRAWRVVKKSTLQQEDHDGGGGEDDLLKVYLRHNMVQFARFSPQAWVLRFLAPAPAGRSFSAEYIRTLDFTTGDVVCGVYVVKLRTRNKVEFEIRGLRTPAAADTSDETMTGGRLVVGIHEDKDSDEYVFSSETVMWRNAEDESMVLPLERAPLMWLHELASWWLLHSGVRYLQDGRKMR